MTKTLKIGKSVELYALNYLQEAGLSCIEQNWSCRFGEIDLIMLERDTVVFVEVRYRKNIHFGGALDSIDQYKRDKLIKTAEYFFNKHPQWLEHPCRFDVITAHPSSTQELTLELNWIQDAFET
ncbi:MAG: YraN family protein [Gammaproteobacteria bacterium]|nr:YraN family protein [Gammaproteobacteria bacterium]